MLFTSQLFVFYFLPIALLAYYLLPIRRNRILLIASYVFYGWWNPWHVLLLLLATLINFLGGRIIDRSPADRRPRAIALAVSLLLSLGMLGLFKYFAFLQENVNALLGLVGIEPWPLLSISLPPGISFFVFLGISYPISRYLEIAPPARSCLDFACFVALFPSSSPVPSCATT